MVLGDTRSGRVGGADGEALVLPGGISATAKEPQPGSRPGRGALPKRRTTRGGQRSKVKGMAHQRTAFVFDLDGTLVDSVYQHVLAWREALQSEGVELSVWRIHRKIGMSGGLFTNMLLRETGLEISAERIERLQRLHAEAYKRIANRFDHSRCARLLAALTDAEIPWAIATSGRMETAGPVLETLGVDLDRVPVITRDLVKYAKPDPDLFLAAASALGVPIEAAPSSATACGTCWRHSAPTHWESVCCPGIRPRRAGACRRLSRLRGPGRPAEAPRRSGREGSSGTWKNTACFETLDTRIKTLLPEDHQ